VSAGVLTAEEGYREIEEQDGKVYADIARKDLLEGEKFFDSLDASSPADYEAQLVQLPATTDLVGETLVPVLLDSRVVGWALIWVDPDRDRRLIVDISIFTDELIRDIDNQEGSLRVWANLYGTMRTAVRGELEVDGLDTFEASKIELMTRTPAANPLTILRRK
jgi:hypothetical protein